MKYKRTSAPAQALPLIVLVAILAALTLLSLLPDNPTFAQTSPPPAIDAPTLTAHAGETAIDLSWTETAGAARYELWAWTAEDGWFQLDDGNLTATTYQHTQTTPGTQYYYAVRAIAAAGAASDWSNYPAATAPTSQTTPLTSTPTATPTQTPTASALTPPSLTAAATQNAIELSWTANTAAVRYQLWAWTTAAGWYQLDDGNLTATSFRHTQVTPGTEYYYTVRAVYASGPPSNWSEYASLTWGAATPTPTATATQTPTSTPTATPSPTPTVAATDRGALVALYNATGGPNWRRSRNWLSDRPLSTWQGVTLDNTGRVGEVRLSNNNLTGRLPDLSALARVRVLDLGTNALTGPLPDLSALTNLGGLDLTSNQITGTIPDLSALTNMTHLYLANNRLTGTIPATLGTIPRLNTLYLGRNQLTGCIPTALRAVRTSDLDTLGLLYCDEATSTPTPTLTPTTTFTPTATETPTATPTPRPLLTSPPPPHPRPLTWPQSGQPSSPSTMPPAATTGRATITG